MFVLTCCIYSPADRVCLPGSVLPDDSTPAPFHSEVKAVRQAPPCKSTRPHTLLPQTAVLVVLLH